MSAAEATATPGEAKTLTQRMLDGIEKAGNKVPHPVMIFVYLILLVIVLSAILAALGVGVTEEVLVPAAPEVVETEYVGGSTEPILVPWSPFPTSSSSRKSGSTSRACCRSRVSASSSPRS